MKEKNPDVKGFKIRKPDSNSVEVSQVNLVSIEDAKKEDNESNNEKNNEKNNVVGGE